MIGFNIKSTLAITIALLPTLLIPIDSKAQEEAAFEVELTHRANDIIGSYRYESSGEGGSTPSPKYSVDKPKHSYFTVDSFDVYSSLNGMRRVHALIRNESGSGVSFKPEHVKAYLGNGTYVSPTKVFQDGPFYQGETKLVTLDFGKQQFPILGLVTRSY
ncbi:hypothetical protein [Vibrio diabolicus]